MTAKQPPNNMPEEELCPHDEHDHGICLDCGEDIHDSLVERAENISDARQDR